MTDAVSVSGGAMSPVKQALLEIRELRARLMRAEAAAPEPVAIVGMGLRFPGGAHDAESFARLLWSGIDAIGDIPADRWPTDTYFAGDPDAPGKMITRQGAFLDAVDQFDADFFGISPREAASMDPQQRLFLEIAWEALENAGQSPAALRGSNTGVYLGISNSDYGRALLGRPELIDAYAGTGSAYSIVAGRLSYFLGLQGPSIAIDTACSSSLVALHLACQALRHGECNMALAGGINLILSPEMNISFTKARMMAPDARCKTFDAAADGYGRGEGCGVVVLRRLSDALARHDRILAVVRGSAVNQDGRSNGLTAPNGPAQEAVIRAALAAAGVPAAAVGYVETHGTGTPLGDPIEVGALAAVFARGRDAAQPLALGSVKTNIGHLEAAAGIAGVIKAILSLQRREIPPNLHFRTGNPRIDWAALPIVVPTAAMPWSSAGDRRIAGVSSFGFSGCNAHVVLEEALPLDGVAPAAQEQDRPLNLIALSARDRASLVSLARNYRSVLTDEVPIADACFTANAGRSHFAERAAFVGRSARDLRGELAAFADGHGDPSIPRDAATQPQVAFLFTGQGSQYAGMGMELYDASPVYRDAMDACAKGLAPYLRTGLLDLLRRTDGDAPIDQTAYAQPALFAIEYALAALWRSWGIEPVAVLGHSLGEYAAACFAGVLPLQDALRLVAARGRLTEAHAEDGTMAAVFGNQANVTAEIARSDGDLVIAAYNGPEHCVISGERTAMSTALDQLQAAGLRVQALRLSYAAHSGLIEPVLPHFRPELDRVNFGPQRITVVSNVTGAPAGAEIGRADYWLTHMRAPVRFADSMRALASLGITHLVEIGPHPVLLGMAAECLGASAAAYLPSLRRNQPAWPEMLESLRRLYVDGADIDWEGFDRGRSRRRVALPTYPFRRRRHWMEEAGTPAPSEPPPDGAAGWQQVTQAIGRQADQGPLDLNPLSYPAKWNCLARLAAAHAIRTLHESAVFSRAGERLALHDVVAAARILDTYAPVVRRWLDDLAARGLLCKDGDSWIAVAPLPDPALDGLWAEAEELFADNRPLLAYVRHCGHLVGRVVRGAEASIETLFPRGSFTLAEDLYERSTTMRYINALATTAAASFCDTQPAGRAVRLLEVGAGTGATTAALLAGLQAGRIHYRFTDVSDAFLARAREKFGAHPNVTYSLFDLDQELSVQGYSPGSVDIVVAANVVHASIDLRAALRRLHEVLAPGGILILVESTTHFAWFDMTTALIEGWRHFADDLRGEQPLLSAPQWLAALSDAGFETARAWPDADSAAANLGQHVLVARVAGTAPVNVAPMSGLATDTDAAAAPAQPTHGVREAVLAALPADRLKVLRDFVRDHIIQVLRRDAVEPPARNDRLTDLGLDSLMATQLRDRLGQGLDLDTALPVSLMFDHPTIERLATYLLHRLEPGRVADALEITPSVAAVAPATLGSAVVEAMTDAQVEALITERLQRRKILERTDGVSGGN
jgi:acyl transferase domain-containing protein/SAM-dependent methyltransferase/acyl carrier protein